VQDFEHQTNMELQTLVNKQQPMPLNR